jgi:hydrogenase maturation protease
VSTSPPVTVIGVGNPYRHDDAAGLVVLEKLRQRFGDDSRVKMVDLDGEPVRLIQSWTGSHTVIIVDAVRSLRPAGTIHRLRADGVTAAEATGMSLGGGHLLGLGEAVDLARALDELPDELVVYGIEGADFRLGEGLSVAVAAACDMVAGELAGQLSELLSRSAAAAPPMACR